MQNARLNEAQAGTKIAGRNIINLRYADDTTLMAECEREQWKSWLKLNIQKMKIIASGPNTSWQIDWKQWETLFSWAPKSLQMVTAALKLKDACCLEEKVWPS